MEDHSWVFDQVDDDFHVVNDDYDDYYDDYGFGTDDKYY